MPLLEARLLDLLPPNVQPLLQRQIVERNLGGVAMNLGKCATCGYVNESATAMCARADCALTPCGAALGGLRCELPRGHADIHQMGKCRWNDGMPTEIEAIQSHCVDITVGQIEIWAKAEREVCARIAESFDKGMGRDYVHFCMCAGKHGAEIAAAIRSHK